MKISIYRNTSISILIFLSFILLSHIVVPNRNLRNIHFSTSALSSSALQMDCLLANSAMNIDNYRNIDNYDKARKRTSLTSSKVSSRNVSVSSKTFSITYYERMEIQNKLPDEDFIEYINNSQLLYNNKSIKTPCSNKAIG